MSYTVYNTGQKWEPSEILIVKHQIDMIAILMWH